LVMPWVVTSKPHKNKAAPRDRSGFIFDWIRPAIAAGRIGGGLNAVESANRLR
jgi:hypothetical protein